MSLVEDPPWERRQTGRASTDFVGIGLIAVGFAALQIMLDRGEDDDWFATGSIRAAAALAAIGLSAAVAWLFYTERPVVTSGSCATAISPWAASQSLRSL